MRGFVRYLACAAALTALFSAPLHAKPHIETLSVGFQTYVTGINNNGTIAGYTVDGSGTYRGFVRQPDGTVTFFDITEPYARYLTTAGINGNGDVTGYYQSFAGSKEVGRGFVRTADGTLTTFGLPKGDNAIEGLVINSSGTVFGNYDRNKSVWYGFARQLGGTITKLQCLSAPIYFRGANDSGQVAGSASSPGIVLNPDGSCTQFDGGSPFAINAEGSVAGVTDSYPWVTNFLRTPDGAMTTYTIPDAYDQAFPVGIDANRVIAGYIHLGFYKWRGYVRGADGHVTVFDAGGGTVGDTAAKSTMPAAINDAGVIVGTFYGSQFASEPTGFIRYP